MAIIRFSVEDANGHVHEMDAQVDTKWVDESFSHLFGVERKGYHAVDYIRCVTERYSGDLVKVTKEIEAEVYANEEQLN